VPSSELRLRVALGLVPGPGLVPGLVREQGLGPGLGLVREQGLGPALERVLHSQ